MTEKEVKKNLQALIKKGLVRMFVRGGISYYELTKEGRLLVDDLPEDSDFGLGSDKGFFNN